MQIWNEESPKYSFVSAKTRNNVICYQFIHGYFFWDTTILSDDNLSYEAKHQGG